MSAALPALLSGASLIVYASALVAVHVQTSFAGVRRHFVSEYANGSQGQVIQVGFAAWCSSLVLAAVAAANDCTASRTQRRVLAALLATAALGVAAIAAFKTETVAGALPPGETRGPGGRAHDYAGVVLQAALLAAVVVSLPMRWSSRTERRAVAVLVAAVLAAAAVLAVIGPSVAGIRQRVLIAAAVAWQALFLRRIWTLGRGGS